MARRLDPAPDPVADHDPLILGQEPRRQQRRRGGHGLIVQLGTRTGGDRAPVPPTCPGAPIDPHHPARLGVADPPGDQPGELLALPRQRLRPWPPDQP